ncbi:MAG TPA: hypothetical protein PKL17_08140 [Pseudomonadota bacterium]|nr:hypothetical protein [Pseudomonadota bacterium]
MNLLGGDWNEWKLTLLAPRSLSGRIVALLIVVVVLGLAVRALRGEQPRRRLLLLSLRTVGLLATLLLFFQPTIRLRNVSLQPNHIAVLVDSSESMRLAEEGGGETRAARAANHLRSQLGALGQWQKDHKVEFYSFGERLQSATWDSVTHPDPANLRADATRIREALSAVRQRYEGRDLAGVVMFSDGLDNGRLSSGLSFPNPEQLSFDADTQEFLRALDVPVHTVAVGKPGLRDIALTRVLADQFAFARTAVEVEARLQVFGAKAAGFAGRHLPVTLRRDGVPVLTVDIEVQPEQRDYRVVFPFTPDRVGKFLYDISVPVQPGEAISENNRRAFVLKVVREKIRVVHVSGRPSWDARFLRAALKSDPNIDLVAFFILRSPSDIEFAPSEETSLIPFPCQELFQDQLRSFDLLILQNFNYSAYCSQFLQPAIVPFVEGGGAVAMLGGDLSFSSGGYYGSEVSQILPVVLPPDELSGAPSSRLIDADPFVPKLTPAGRNHVVTALHLDVKENAQRWEQLPPLDGLNLVQKARQQATVLLSHPRLKDQDGNPMPVLSVAELGKGRTLALQADSTWKWAFAPPQTGKAAAKAEGDTRSTTYQRFFDQAIRWLIRDPSLRLLRVEVAETELRRGQPVRVEVRALGPDYQPVGKVEVSLSLQRIAGTESGATSEPLAESVMSKTLHTDEEGVGSIEWPQLPEGGYRVIARAVIAGRPTDDSDVFLVRGIGRELEAPEADDRLLKLVSETTGGDHKKPGDSLMGLSFHPPHIEHVRDHRDIPLWDNPLVLAIAVTCFGLNWTLRRRWGYA